MIPGSVVGLVLFIALLAPGFVYLEKREQRHPGVKYSAMRETSLVVLTSLISVGVALALLGTIRALLPHLTPDAAAYIRGGSAYVKTHYVEALLWGAGLLTVACVAAGMFAAPPQWLGDVGSDALNKWVTRRRGAGGLIMQQSGWGLGFTTYPHTRKFLEVVLTDGTCINGSLGSYSTQIEESNDRDLILAAPISVRELGGEWTQLRHTGLVVVSAAKIKYLAIQFVGEPTDLPTVRSARKLLRVLLRSRSHDA